MYLNVKPCRVRQQTARRIVITQAHDVKRVAPNDVVGSLKKGGVYLSWSDENVSCYARSQEKEFGHLLAMTSTFFLASRNKKPMHSDTHAISFFFRPADFEMKYCADVVRKSPWSTLPGGDDLRARSGNKLRSSVFLQKVPYTRVLHDFGGASLPRQLMIVA